MGSSADKRQHDENSAAMSCGRLSSAPKFDPHNHYQEPKSSITWDLPCGLNWKIEKAMWNSPEDIEVEILLRQKIESQKQNMEEVKNYVQG